MPLAPVRKVFRSKTPALRVDAHHADTILHDIYFAVVHFHYAGGEHLKHPCKSERVFLMRVMLQYFKVLFFLSIEERKVLDKNRYPLFYKIYRVYGVYGYIGWIVVDYDG